MKASAESRSSSRPATLNNRRDAHSARSKAAFTVALVGPDGAGKTTLGRRLERIPELRVKYIYLGINPDASNFMLPTTRLWFALKRARGRTIHLSGPRALDQDKPLPKGWLKRTALEMKSGLRVLNQIAEEWFRQGVIWYYLRRGYIVLTDRHFLFDYYFYDVAQGGRERLLSSRLHGLLLERYYPRPDLVIHLDAPTEVLLARKAEGTVETMEHRRREYLGLRNLVTTFVTVDATQAQDKVLLDVTELIRGFRNSHEAA